jgi:hypothetical protein
VMECSRLLVPPTSWLIGTALRNDSSPLWKVDAAGYMRALQVELAL